MVYELKDLSRPVTSVVKPFCGLQPASSVEKVMSLFWYSRCSSAS